MNDDRIARLERLSKLRDEGSLSQEEFDTEKARVLNAADQSVSSEAKADATPTPIKARTSPLSKGWLIGGLGALIFTALVLVATLIWDRGEPGSTLVDEGSQVPIGSGAPIAAGTSEQAVPPDQPEATSPSTSKTPVPPKITGDWRNFRTRIREGWGTEPDFAGRYVIIRMGCGAGCTFGIVGDHQTGELYDLGLGGEEQMYLDLRYGNESDLITARWDDYENCTEQLYTWTGTGLRPLGEPQVRPRGEEPCDMSY